MLTAGDMFWLASCGDLQEALLFCQDQFSVKKSKVEHKYCVEMH
ncbi:hypothetical protein THTE_2934 [Thermogutta terrifontis]|jgi:hypothetical protein|uniref:Uncharacterized protein n=1 Tax=Thermogutta terrifontis TaxID=1331910 RepID=A0A286RHX8_9BACT|nr:hypothetical protein THTE_2934 [Thermogutta terrifontis]